MIFITLGSQKFQFNRLIKTVDELVGEGKIKEEVFAQIGYSDYQPVNYKYKRFLDRDEFSNMEEKATVLITHGGTGAIVGAIKKGKKVIAVPRLVQYGEHIDDHQLQIINQFKKDNLICGLEDCSQLEESLNYVFIHKFNSYRSNTNTIINSIEEFIRRECL